MTDPVEVDRESVEVDTFDPLITEEDIEHATNRPFSVSKLLYADTAVNIGHECGALSNAAQAVLLKQTANCASMVQQNQFRSWDNALHAQAETRDVLDEIDVDDEPLAAEHIDPALTSPPSATPITSSDVSPVLSTPTSLNTKQRMVHTIVTNHLHSFLKGENPPQRLMIVHGQGGTGKSALLNAISQTFADLRSSPLLAKTAMSRVAASIIRGQTLHSWASLPIAVPTTDRWLTHPGKEVEKR